MRVLVSTHETQGYRKNDFCWANDGELVNFHFECDGETVDGHCGCHRSLSGLESHKATTTVKVVEMEITLRELAERIRASLKAAGWLEYSNEQEIIAWVNQDAGELTKVAKYFPVGTVLEKRGGSFQNRVIKKK